MNCINLTSKTSNQRKTTKVILFRWICIDLTSIHQKTQNYKVNQITMNFHRFEVKTIKNFKLRRKTFKTTQNYESDQIIDELHRFDVKTIKTFELRRKTTKVIKLQWIASIGHQNDLKCWVTSQNIQNNAKLRKWSNYNELHQFDVKTIKMLSYVAKHSKQRKTTKVIKLKWIASIWH